MIEKTERLIAEINRIHGEFSKDYFNDYFAKEKIEKVNLAHTIEKIDVEYIYKYRLYLHESINDYLMRANLSGIEYYYRVKTRESIDDKIARYSQNSEQFKVNDWLNDIFGARMIHTKSDIIKIKENLNYWKEKFGLKKWYEREKDGYKGIHVYFKNASNYFFPWELQIWDRADVEENIKSHIEYKREFMKKM